MPKTQIDMSLDELRNELSQSCASSSGVNDVAQKATQTTNDAQDTKLSRSCTSPQRTVSTSPSVGGVLDTKKGKED